MTEFGAELRGKDRSRTGPVRVDLRDILPDRHQAAGLVTPPSKRPLSLRLDADVIDWFRRQGPGCQTRLNAVLRVLVQRQGKPPLA